MTNLLTTNLLTTLSQVPKTFDQQWEEFWSIGHLTIVFLKLSLIPISLIIIKSLVLYSITKVKRMERTPFSAEDLISGEWKEKQMKHQAMINKRNLNNEVKLSKSSSAIGFVFKFWYYSHFKPHLLEREPLKIEYTPKAQRSFEVECLYEAVKIKFGVAMKNRMLSGDQISVIVKFLEENLEFERYPKTKDKKNRYNNDAHFIYSCLKHSEKLNVEILKAFNEFLSEYCDIESIVEDMSENEDIQKDNVLSMSKYKAK